MDMFQKQISDLCLMAFAGFEFHLTFQVNVPGSKKPFIQIAVKCPDRHFQLRVVCDDLIRGLPLCDQRGDDHVFLSQFMLCHVDTGAGIRNHFPVFSVGEFRVMAVFLCDRAAVNGFCAAVADIRCFIEAAAPFLLKVRTGLVAGGTGGAFHITEDDLTTHIRLPAMVTVDTEIVCIIKSAFVVPVIQAVSSYLFGNRCGIFAEEPGDLLKREPLIQGALNISAVIESKMFLVAFNKFTHGIPPLLLSGGLGKYNTDM